jgi:hypothetical protein
VTPERAFTASIQNGNIGNPMRVMRARETGLAFLEFVT